ncbi:hypothetical protein KHQ81_15550 (plasmid) [Mycoplasmatota bacterium]|nr:hypothetical protein KHQ81_15550 [Mycoplasmatota bacterium]
MNRQQIFFKTTLSIIAFLFIFLVVLTTDDVHASTNRWNQSWVIPVDSYKNLDTEIKEILGTNIKIIYENTNPSITDKTYVLYYGDVEYDPETNEYINVNRLQPVKTERTNNDSILYLYEISSAYEGEEAKVLVTVEMYDMDVDKAPVIRFNYIIPSKTNVANVFDIEYNDVKSQYELTVTSVLKGSNISQEKLIGRLDSSTKKVYFEDGRLTWDIPVMNDEYQESQEVHEVSFYGVLDLNRTNNSSGMFIVRIALNGEVKEYDLSTNVRLSLKSTSKFDGESIFNKYKTAFDFNINKMNFNKSKYYFGTSSFRKGSSSLATEYAKIFDRVFTSLKANLHKTYYDENDDESIQLVLDLQQDDVYSWQDYAVKNYIEYAKANGINVSSSISYNSLPHTWLSNFTKYNYYVVADSYVYDTIVNQGSSNVTVSKNNGVEYLFNGTNGYTIPVEYYKNYVDYKKTYYEIDLVNKFDYNSYDVTSQLQAEYKDLTVVTETAQRNWQDDGYSRYYNVGKQYIGTTSRYVEANNSSYPDKVVYNYGTSVSQNSTYSWNEAQYKKQWYNTNVWQDSDVFGYSHSGFTNYTSKGAYVYSPTKTYYHYKKQVKENYHKVCFDKYRNDTTYGLDFNYKDEFVSNFCVYYDYSSTSYIGDDNNFGYYNGKTGTKDLNGGSLTKYYYNDKESVKNKDNVYYYRVTSVTNGNYYIHSTSYDWYSSSQSDSGSNGSENWTDYSISSTGYYDSAGRYYNSAYKYISQFTYQEWQDMSSSHSGYEAPKYTKYKPSASSGYRWVSTGNKRVANVQRYYDRQKLITTYVNPVTTSEKTYDVDKYMSLNTYHYIDTNSDGLSDKRYKYSSISGIKYENNGSPTTTNYRDNIYSYDYTKYKYYDKVGMKIYKRNKGFLDFEEDVYVKTVYFYVDNAPTYDTGLKGQTIYRDYKLTDSLNVSSTADGFWDGSTYYHYKQDDCGDGDYYIYNSFSSKQYNVTKKQVSTGTTERSSQTYSDGDLYNTTDSDYYFDYTSTYALTYNGDNYRHYTLTSNGKKYVTQYTLKITPQFKWVHEWVARGFTTKRDYERLDGNTYEDLIYFDGVSHGSKYVYTKIGSGKEKYADGEKFITLSEYNQNPNAYSSNSSINPDVNNYHSSYSYEYDKYKLYDKIQMKIYKRNKGFLDFEEDDYVKTVTFYIDEGRIDKGDGLGLHNMHDKDLKGKTIYRNSDITGSLYVSRYGDGFWDGNTYYHYKQDDCDDGDYYISGGLSRVDINAIKKFVKHGITEASPTPYEDGQLYLETDDDYYFDYTTKHESLSYITKYDQKQYSDKAYAGWYTEDEAYEIQKTKNLTIPTDNVMARPRVDYMNYQLPGNVAEIQKKVTKPGLMNQYQVMKLNQEIIESKEKVYLLELLQATSIEDYTSYVNKTGIYSPTPEPTEWYDGIIEFLTFGGGITAKAPGIIDILDVGEALERTAGYGSYTGINSNLKYYVINSDQENTYYANADDYIYAIDYYNLISMVNNIKNTKTMKSHFLYDYTNADISNSPIINDIYQDTFINGNIFTPILYLDEEGLSGYKNVYQEIYGGKLNVPIEIDMSGGNINSVEMVDYYKLLFSSIGTRLVDPDYVEEQLANPNTYEGQLVRDFLQAIADEKTNGDINKLTPQIINDYINGN